jgi:hypothetical protein
MPGFKGKREMAIGRTDERRNPVIPVAEPSCGLVSMSLGLAFARVRTALSNAAICSRSYRQATSMVRTIGAKSSRSASNASTRRSNGRPRIAPGSIPNVYGLCPRRDYPVSIHGISGRKNRPQLLADGRAGGDVDHATEVLLLHAG